MAARPTMATYMPRHQPLTPVSPLLPTTLPHVCEPIPPLPMTPPDADEVLDAASNEAALRTGLHVISTARDAVGYMWQLLHSNPVAQEGFMTAVNVIARTIHRHGKLVVSGIGKSAKIAKKVEATMNSFAIRSQFLHPTDALHGDLGSIGENDALLLFTFSGRTQELSGLLQHIPYYIPLMVVTSHIHPSTCPLFAGRDPANCILLPAPIPTSETTSFGVPAPTTSTTNALVLSDALAIAVARRLHPTPADVFHKYHPGGAIGATAQTLGPRRMADLATDVASVPIAQKVQQQQQKQKHTPHHHSSSSSSSSITALDILLTAARSPSGWVRLSSTAIIAPRQIQKLGCSTDALDRAIHALEPGVVVEQSDWISIEGVNSVEEARQWIVDMRVCERGRAFLKPGTVLGIVDAKSRSSGVVEIEDVFDFGLEGDGGFEGHGDGDGDGMVG
ncbi:hypothetical protein MMC19_005495 [Ptychographa xylographoides]|nr:hypothetical protein [Ptychographa xylographoides]